MTQAETRAAPSRWKPTRTTGRSVTYWTKPIAALGELDAEQAQDGRAGGPVTGGDHGEQQADRESDEQEHQVGVQLAHLQRVEAVALGVRVAGVRARSR